MRVILLVLDGLGVGEMPDVSRERPQDEGANTLRSLIRNVRHLDLPNLIQLGIGNIISPASFRSGSLAPRGRRRQGRRRQAVMLRGRSDRLQEEFAHPSPLASYGRCRLAHTGADSYLGHQEIMGTIPKPPMKTLMVQAADHLEKELAARGHAVRRPLAGTSLLLVDEAVVIGDNLEADPGLNINVTVATDSIDFEEALRIGEVVRESVRVGRVIVFGGPGITPDDILRLVEQRENGQVGVDSPALGVYNEHLQIQHMGYGVDPDRQAASLVSRMGIPVILLGKMADLIVCSGAIKDPIVPTSLVMAALLDFYRRSERGLIAATLQETDLAAHEGDVFRVASVLEEVDKGLGVLLPEIVPGDVLIICADHGNDPQKNVGLHTREETPLLIYRKGQPATSLGVRDTLADIGATIAYLFNAPPTQDGAIIVNQRTL